MSACPREEEPRRSLRVIDSDLRRCVALYVRPDWQQWCLERLPQVGQLELFK